MNKHIKGKDGFTIIEVVLVLAIAGLIFLMVFIALPALQRNQRDTQRKNDISRAVTALNNYTSANRNTLPTNYNTQLATQRLRVNGDTFADPSRGDYTFVAGTGTVTYVVDQNPPQIQVAVGQRCDGENLVPAGSRNVAFRIALEGGGIACASS